MTMTPKEMDTKMLKMQRRGDFLHKLGDICDTLEKAEEDLEGLSEVYVKTLKNYNSYGFDNYGNLKLLNELGSIKGRLLEMWNRIKEASHE